MADEAAPTSAIQAAPSRYGIRHDPAIIQAVHDGILAMRTGEQIAKDVGISPATLETVVAENDALRLSRSRVREALAETLVDEAQAIVDAPIGDPETASAEVTRARNRADFRKWRAGCYNRDLYGERVAQVQVQVNNVVVTLADMAPKPVDAVDAEADAMPRVEVPDGADPLP